MSGMETRPFLQGAGRPAGLVQPDACPVQKVEAVRSITFKPMDAGPASIWASGSATVWNVFAHPAMPGANHNRNKQREPRNDVAKPVVYERRQQPHRAQHTNHNGPEPYFHCCTPSAPG